MTSYKVSPIAPPTLGEVLGSPVAYAEAMIAAQTPPPFTSSAARPVTCRVKPRHARRMGRPRLAVRVAVLAVTGLAVAGCAVFSHPATARAQRPVWDGTGTYDSGIEPLCPAQLTGRTARAGAPGHEFTVTCVWDGSEFAWGVVAGGAR